MSSNAPHSSMRRYVIAAIAAIGCLLPAACDVAAASPGYHNDRPGQGQQVAAQRRPGPAPTAPARTARAPPRRRPPSRRTSRATRARPKARRQGEGQAQGEGQGQGNPGDDPANGASVAPTVDASASAAATVAPAAGAEQRPRRAGPGLLEEQAHATRRLPEGARLRLDRVRRGRCGRQRPDAAHHRLAAVRASQHGVHAQGEHPQPDQGPVPRCRRRRLLPGELGAEERHPARPLPHRLPHAVQHPRRRPRPTRCPPSSWRRRTTAVAPPRTP